MLFTPSLIKKLFTFFLLYLISSNLFAFPIDTLPEFPTKGHGNKWVELGIGGSIGSHNVSDFNRNFWNPPDERITTQSINFTGSYNYGLERGWIGIGFKGSLGTVSFEEEIVNQTGFTYTAIGSYAVVEQKLVGFAAGFLFISNEDESYFYEDDLYPILNIRIGNISSYYVDIVCFDEYGMGTFPQPNFSIGIINYGFDDPSGMRKARFGAASIGGETAVTIGFRHPISQAPLLFDGAVFYSFGQFIANIGIRYRFDMSWK